MKLELQDVMKSYKISELSPDPNEFVIEFEFTVNKYVVTFQSLPMPKVKAYDVGQAILTWANEYNVIRKKVGLLVDSIHSIRNLASNTVSDLSRIGG